MGVTKHSWTYDKRLGRSQWPKPCPCCGQRVHAPTVKYLVLAAKLQPLMERILSAIWKGGGQPIFLPAIFAAICAARDKHLSATERELYFSFKVALFYIRARLKGSGVSIETVGYRQGYRIVIDPAVWPDADRRSSVDVSSLVSRLPDYAVEKGIARHERGVIEGFLRDAPASVGKASAASEPSCPCCEQRAIVPSFDHIVETCELSERDECILRTIWDGQGVPVTSAKVVEALFADDLSGALAPGSEYGVYYRNLARLSKRIAGSGVAIVQSRRQRGCMLALTGDHSSIGEADEILVLVARIPAYAKRKGLTEHSRRVIEDFLRFAGSRDLLGANGFPVAHSAGPLPPINRSSA